LAVRTLAVPPAPLAHVALTEEQLRNRRRRNVAIALAVGLLVAFFYVITIVKLGPGVLRPEP
jgi:multisubunit Na+/H+ antiporter MnhB subunit